MHCIDMQRRHCKRCNSKRGVNSRTLRHFGIQPDAWPTRSIESARLSCDTPKRPTASGEKFISMALILPIQVKHSLPFKR